MVFRGLRNVLGLLTKRQRVRFLGWLLFRVSLGALDLVALASLALFLLLLTNSGEGAKVPLVSGLELDLSFEEHGVFLLVLVGLIFTSKSVIASFVMWKIARMLGSLEAQVSGKIVSLLAVADNTTFREFSSEDLLWATGGSVSSLITQRLSAITGVATEAAMILMVLVFLLTVNPVVTAAVVLYFLMVGLAYHFAVSRFSDTQSQKFVASNVLSTGVVQDVIRLHRELILMGKVDGFINKFLIERQAMARASALLGFIQTMPRVVLEAALFFGASVFLVVVLLQRGLGEGLVEFSVFMVGGMRLLAGLIPLQGHLTALRSEVALGGAAEDAIFRLSRLGSDSKTEDGAGPTRESGERGPVEVVLEGVSFQHPGESFALEDVNLRIPPGATVAIVGPSGAGKSTLLDLIMGFEVPSLGDVKINNAKPSDFVRRFRGRVGLVPQRPASVKGSVRQNITLDEKAQDQSRLTEVVRLSGLTELVGARPAGVELDLGKQLDGLSGGQIQRINLARALYSEPDLLLLDEATSALDLITEAEVFSNVSGRRFAGTTIVVTHRISTIQNADIVLLLEGGKVTDCGSFSEVATRNPIVQSYVKLSEFEDLGPSE